MTTFHSRRRRQKINYACIIMSIICGLFLFSTYSGTAYGEERCIILPRAHWDMEAGYGTSVFYDVTSNDNDGTTYTDVWADSFFGHCLRLGENRFAAAYGPYNRVTAPENLLEITSAITVEAWVRCQPDIFYPGFPKHEPIRADPTILVKEIRRDANESYSEPQWTGGNIWWLSINDQGNPAFWVNTTQGQMEVAAVDVDMSDFNWHHIVGTFDETSVKIYVDGVERGSVVSQYLSQLADDPSDMDRVRFGGAFGVDQPPFFEALWFSGNIDEAKVYSYALSPEEVYQRYEAIPLASWEMNDYPGTTLYDRTDNNNDGTIYTAQWVDGKGPGVGLRFYGYQDYVEIPQSNSLWITDDITVSAWVKINTPGWRDCFIVCKEIGSAWNDYIWGIYKNSADSASFYVRSSSAGIIAAHGSVNIADGNWHHLIGIFNGRNAFIFIDGNLGGEAHYSTRYEQTLAENQNAKIHIAKWQGDNGYFNGTVDKVKIFRQAITSQDFIMKEYRGYDFAVASSTQNGGYPYFDVKTYNPNKAADGNYSNTRWSSAWTDNEWIYFDLKEPKTFNTVRLKFEYARAREFAIDISNDAVNWTEVAHIYNNNSYTRTINVGQRTARFVRMRGITRATQYGYSLWEFEVW